MSDGLQADPEILERVWGSILPKASNFYDDAIERMSRVAPGYNRRQEPHVLEFVESSWRRAIDNPGCATDMLRQMQQTLLATARAVKACMDVYVAADEASAMRLAAADVAASETTGPPPLNPTVDLE